MQSSDQDGFESHTVIVFHSVTLTLFDDAGRVVPSRGIHRGEGGFLGEFGRSAVLRGVPELSIGRNVQSGIVWKCQ